MSIFEYDKELEEKKLRKAEFEAGHEVGLAEGKNQAAFETAKRMLALQEFTPEKIAVISGLPLDEVRKLHIQQSGGFVKRGWN